MTHLSDLSSAPREPRLERLRTLWVMVRPPNKPLTATIYAVDTGRELRVIVGNDAANTIDTLLSRTDDAALERRADVLREVLLGKGWTLEAAVS